MEVAGVDGGKLASCVDKIERIEGEIKELQDDKREFYAEAKALGFDAPTIRRVIKRRKEREANPEAFEERQYKFDLYWRALEGGRPESEAA